MVFGINVFQSGGRFGGLEDKEGLLTRDSYLESIDAIADIGFRHIEILTDPLMVALPEGDLSPLLQDVAEVGHRRGVTFSVHAPFWWIDIATPAEEMRRASVRTIVKVVEASQPLEATHFVIHPLNRTVPARIAKSRASDAIRSAALDRFYATAARSLTEIVGEVPERNTICIENMPHDKSHGSIVELAERTNTSICFDSGHSYLHTLDVYESLDEHYPRMKAIHAHNILLRKAGGEKDCRMEDHHSLRSGLIDNKGLIEELSTRGFTGHFVVEVMSRADALDSAAYLKELGLL